MNLEKALSLTEMAMSKIQCLEYSAAMNEAYNSIQELKQYLSNSLTEQMAKENGGITEKNRFTTAKKYIEKSIKINEYRKNVHGVWYDNNKNYQYITDTHSVFKLYSHIQGLPEVPDDIIF